jgi:hypothetical protein
MDTETYIDRASGHETHSREGPRQHNIKEETQCELTG